MSLHEQLAPASISRRLAAIRALFKFMCRTKRIEKDISDGLRNPKQTTHLPNVLSFDEVLRLLRCAPVAKDPRLAARNLALIELIYGSGIRVSEAVGLNLGDVDLALRQAKVMGKGRKMRLAPFGQAAEVAVRQWLKQRESFLEGRHESGERPPVFVNMQRARLSPRSVRRILEKRCMKAGLVRTVGPHALRHSFATHLLDGGAGIREVQELLGHEQLTTTQRYTHVSLVKMQRTYDASHPRAQLTSGEPI